ncbi:MAG: hypothetical protein FJ271_19185 [Planctomycetes bacterium]|nr:hypothetical protein [Planctomycetota bacterium]
MPGRDSSGEPKAAGRDRRNVALVTTTINVPRCLTNYLENAQRYGHLDQVSVVVIGDRKTPAETPQYLQGLQRQFGVSTQYLDVPAQQKFLRRWPALDITLRYNCIQRRNVGYLQAAIDGADVIVAVDDDNFVTEEDYVGAHLRVGRTVEVPVVEHPSGWWNICQRLTCDPPRHFYHRGYPKSRQTFKQNGQLVKTATVRPAVNAGLWLKNPDVDATTNIEEPINVVGMEPIAGNRACALAPGTWCPFNSQNTAFNVATLPAMYLVVMLDTIRGYRIGRLDDIWMSYFLRVIADQLGDAVLYGPPLVVQDRNPHNFVRDLSEELPGYILTERLVEYLRDFKTGERSYLAAYLDLIYHLRDRAEDDAALETPEREYFRQMTLGMAAWHAAAADVLR